MHIVLMRFSSLGDIVLQTPLIAWIKKHYPKTRITFVTSQEFSHLVKDHPFIDDVIFHTRAKGIQDIKQLLSLTKKIRSLKADLILDLHDTLRAKIIRQFSYNTPAIKVNKRTLLRKILVHFKIDWLKRLKSHHERVIDDFKFLFSKSYERTELENYIQGLTQQTCASLSSIPESFQKEVPQEIAGKYVVISPVASFEPKRWPIEKFQTLIQMFLTDESLQEYKIVILGGPSDKYCQQLTSDATAATRLINLQGKTSLAQTNQILKYAKVVLTNDTGVGHMAEALGVSALTIFGPTSPSFGFRPHLGHSKVISINAPCSPCSVTGSKPCYRKDHFCMMSLAVDDVFKELKLQLEQVEKC